VNYSFKIDIWTHAAGPRIFGFCGY